MQLEQTRRDVNSSGVMQVARATVAPSKKIFDMFSDQTYANKPVAILRELVANGIDAQRKTCPERPIEVVLPTPFDPTCRIRDFGTGMAHDFVMGPFMAYTDGSTKDKSDEDIGGFGIGSKSPFSYVDQYSLRVVHEGVLSVYTMFKDDEGFPCIGLQGQTTTDEPNGVEVSFPVEDADMDTFAKAAQEALQYFRPLPLVTNGTLNPPDYTYTGNGWAMRTKGGELGIIMGGVRYPAVKASMDYKLQNDSRVGPLLTYGLDLTLPIGACGIAMSREQLSYTPKTSASIKAALEAVIDDVVETFSNYFDNCPSMWEAMKLLYNETGMDGYSRNGRQQLLLGNAKYQGHRLETSFAITPDACRFGGITVPDAWLIEPRNRRRSPNCPSPRWQPLTELYGLSPHSIETVIIDDLPLTPKSKAVARIREYIDTRPQAKQTLVVRSDKVEVIKQLLRGPVGVVLSSTMPMPTPKAKRVAVDRPRVRMFTFNGKTDKYTHRTITNLSPARSKSEAVAEIAYADQPASGIMVVMENFDLPKDFDRKMSTRLVKYDELRFVNASDAPKIKANFKDFEAVFAERLAAELAKYPDLAQRVAVSADKTINSWSCHFRELSQFYTTADLSVAAQGRPFGKLWKMWETYAKSLTYEQMMLGNFVTAKLPSGARPEALAKAVADRHQEVQILVNVLNFDKESHCKLFMNNL